MNATAISPTSSEASKYRAILDRRIQEGRARAGSVIEAIHANVPTDQIVPTGRVQFVYDQDRAGVRVAFSDAVDQALTISDHALAQVAERGQVPTAYLRELSGGEPWQRELATIALNRSYQNIPRERVLARSVRGQLRGWLSDRFRRLDSRPLVDALAKSAQELGAIPFDGSATETRVALKVILPEIVEPIPGEFMVRGLEWSNSDFGNGTNSIRQFALRVACLNGMTRENLIREIHLGGRLSDNFEYSERTLQLDTARSVSAMRDVVRGALGPRSLEKLTESLRAANEREASAATVRGALKGFPKATVKAAVDAFESEDVINLPAGQTAWRASNALSWIARHEESAELRLDLERAAGSVVS